ESCGAWRPHGSASWKHVLVLRCCGSEFNTVSSTPALLRLQVLPVATPAALYFFSRMCGGGFSMNESARKARNKQRLGECFPAFAQRVQAVIHDLEAENFRPRIQEAHRSIEDQLLAFKNGNSQVKFGFHNVTGSDGKPEALAVDLLD